MPGDRRTLIDITQVVTASALAPAFHRFGEPWKTREAVHSIFKRKGSPRSFRAPGCTVFLLDDVVAWCRVAGIPVIETKGKTAERQMKDLALAFHVPSVRRVEEVPAIVK